MTTKLVNFLQKTIHFLAEKISALMTEDYLVERAKHGSREKFEAALSKIPDVEPDEEDRL